MGIKKNVVCFLKEWFEDSLVFDAIYIFLSAISHKPLKDDSIKEEYLNSPCINKRKSDLKFEITDIIRQEVKEEWSNWYGCFDSEFTSHRYKYNITEYLRTYSKNIFVRI